MCGKMRKWFIKRFTDGFDLIMGNKNFPVPQTGGGAAAWRHGGAAGCADSFWRVRESRGKEEASEAAQGETAGEGARYQTYTIIDFCTFSDMKSKTLFYMGISKRAM